MDNQTKMNKEDVERLLNNTVDCSITIDPSKSVGFEEVKRSESNEVILTRSDLEKLISVSKEIAFSSFHSSGVNNAGNHVSA